jgi:hypothetical protein
MDVMNEATLESRIAQSLSRVFPTIDAVRITVQKTFTIRAGRQIIKVDGLADHIHGRLDLLVELNGSPVVLLEIKSPDHELTDTDAAQAFSYAQLHQPIVPIVVVTNGIDVRLYRAYDQQRWDATGLDENNLQALLKSASKQAGMDFDRAVRTALEGSPALWHQALRKATESALAGLSAEISDLTSPLSRTFQVPRKMPVLLREILLGGARAIALVGPPLSGKTNVLAQLCQQSAETELVPHLCGLLRSNRPTGGNWHFSVSRTNEIH